jgi:hypothetical protein
LLLSMCVQDVSHGDGGARALVAVNVSVDGSQKMAGFEVSINGRFWVSTEAMPA